MEVVHVDTEGGVWVTSVADVKSVQGALRCSPAAVVVQWSSRVWSGMCEEGGWERVEGRWEREVGRGEWVS